MKPVESHVLVATEMQRLAACLVHAVPSATAVVHMTTGERLVVARNRIDAALDPCHLRAGLAAPFRPGVPHVADVVRSIEIVGGIVDLGGGLYQRAHPSTADERWFVTTITARRVAELVATYPVVLPDDAINVRVAADTVLGASAVCLVAGPGFGYRLDEVAHWLHATCLVEELTGCGTADDVGRPG